MTDLLAICIVRWVVLIQKYLSRHFLGRDNETNPQNRKLTFMQLSKFTNPQISSTAIQ